MNRRELLAFATLSGLSEIGPGARADAAAQPPSAGAGRAPSGAVPAALKRFIPEYMRAMNAPGLTLALASRAGPLAVESFGFVDLAARTPLTTAHRFQIGSITKSFTALMILQLQDEGKLDVQQPILRHLPWLPVDTDYGEIRIHHLLTHSSGMPSDPPVVPTEPAQRVRQAFRPGSQFHYSNWGYDVLGRLIEKLDGSSWQRAVTRRLLVPLGMNDTRPIIDSSGRSRLAQSYVPREDDRPYPRHGALVPAGNLTFTLASGCISSTPLDMARYLHMLLNSGAAPAGRVASEEGFRLFSTPSVKAEEFGPGAHYAYGIAVDELDGHKRLRHTGGMVSFMSALQLDMESGFGAFASVNAQLGYRPNPVAQYAIKLLRASTERAPAPVPPPADEAAVLANAADYIGSYAAPDGRSLSVDADGNRLVLTSDGVHIPLQHVEEDQFIADHRQFALFPIVFGRDHAPAGDTPPAEPKPAVIELAYGPDWYAHSRHGGQQAMPDIPGLAPYPGVYYSDSAWIGLVRIVVRRGQLWVNGVLPTELIGDGLFRLTDEPASPEMLEFRNVIGGKARILVFGGGLLQRLDAADEI
ncbi:MAG: serine hydrolase domain-containing protein [Steroidobacteraceae bacterium]